ncbi:MAG TPA: serine hydrolase, partial [Acidobacteriaceae bacterium]|nr:serine hydrolase [Acidobacteriaceae bacterium]
MRKRWLCGLGVGLLVVFHAVAQSAPEDARRARLDAVARSYTKGNAFMGAVLVAEGDTLLLSKGYGQADAEWNIPNAPDVKFRLGSITKQFTAALVLLLQQDGKLKIEDPVSKYLPDSPKAWEKITLAELLGHTSGIPNFTSEHEFMTWRMNPHTVDEEISFFKDRPLEFEPGTKFEYSNSNYEVLGAVIEKVSGRSYGDLLKERLFQPLGMHDTGLDTDELILPKRAQGYSPRQGGGLEHAVSESMTVPWAAGSLYSTTGDLLLWERGLFGGKVLNAASLKQMTTPGKGSYALGLFVHPQDGVTVVNHGGGIEGFNTDLTYVPEKALTVVVLGNVNGTAPGDMGAKLVSVALGKTVVLANERKEQPIDKAELAKFGGTYRFTPAFAITITAEGDQLVEQATGQTKL